MAVTMKDVAEHANLSLGTVSNYVTGKVKVSEEKQKRIEAAITELGYKLNISARTLRTNSFHSIGVIIPSFRNVYLLRVISVIEELLRAKGYSIVVASYQDATEQSQISELAMRVDGVIYVPRAPHPDTLEEIKRLTKQMPFVVFDESLYGVTCDSVLVNGRKVVKETVTKLIAHGHRHIGLLAGPHYAHTSQQRLLGYRDALEESGQPMEHHAMLFCDYTKHASATACEELLQQNRDLTAVMAVGYRMTLGAAQTLCKLGLQDTVTLIGYDASDMDGIFTPPIGYVYQPYDKVATHVVDLMLRRVNKDMDGFPETIYLEADIKNIQAPHTHLTTQV